MSPDPFPVVQPRSHLLRDSSLISLKPITVIKWEAVIVISRLVQKSKLADGAGS